MHLGKPPGTAPGTRTFIAWLVVISCLLLIPPPTQADVPGELLLFPKLDAVHRSGAAPGSALEDDELIPAIDIFYSTDIGDLQVLVEYFANDEEHEVERLQLGWRFHPGTIAWLGRFHNPIGYWNTQFHHGGHLQTSVSRPGIIEFEDDGGPLPTHVTGLLIEDLHAAGDAGLSYTFGLGAGPELNDHGLEAVDIVDPDDGSHKLTTSLKLSYHPQAFDPTVYGFFVGYAQIPSNAAMAEEVKQTQTGLFANWEQGRLRLLGAAFYIWNEVNLPAGNVDGHFFNAYGQAEFAWHPNWTVFGRLEDTANEESDPYLQAVSDFVKRRSLIGVRYDISRRQALTLELSDVHRQQDTFSQFVLQWSAVFP